MSSMRIIEVPTGKIFVLKGDDENKRMECLSLRDYGQPKNCKAQFLGLNDDINGVDNDNPLLPFEDKWVITISTQYGCACNCRFCDVPRVKFQGNISYHEMMRQVNVALFNEPQVKHPKRINLHYARMGEPTFNRDVFDHVRGVKEYIRLFYGDRDIKLHPVISTMMPRSNPHLEEFVNRWCTNIKNNLFNGDAGLQLSINSTDDKQREFQFGGHALPLRDIATIAKALPKPWGRKYTLNFALADDTIIDAQLLAELFGTEKFIVKITPVHNTKASEKNGIKTAEGYERFTPYQKAEEELIKAGFDVLIFVPSYNEEVGRITCGNAILSDAYC